MAAASDMKQGAVGIEDEAGQGRSAKSAAGQGFEPDTIAVFLRRNADLLESAKLPERGGVSVGTAASETSRTLRKLADEMENKKPVPRLEDLERHLTVLEEKLLAALLAATEDEEMVMVRTEADLDLAPFRRKMPAAQIDQWHKQYVHKRRLG